MRLFYKGLALAFAAGIAGAAVAKTEFGDNAARREAFESPFAAPPRSAFATNPNPAARDARPHSAVQVTPVPEPGEWALMAVGVALVGVLARRRSKKNASSNPPKPR